MKWPQWDEPLTITVSKKTLFLGLTGVIGFWLLLTVIHGHGWTAAWYGSYFSDYDYDEAGCPAVSFPERIVDLRRILLSVRSEVVDSSSRLDASNKQFEEVAHQITEKQNQLAQVQAEIENAKSLLRDLNDRRNVRVSLPSRPLLPNNSMIISRKERTGSLEDSIDYSRCSLTTPLRVFLYPNARGNALYDVIKESAYHDPSPYSACLFVVVLTEQSNSSLKDLPYWSETGANHVVINTGTTSITLSETQAQIVQTGFLPGSFRRSFDVLLLLATSSLRRRSIDDWQRFPQLLPYSRKYMLTVVVRDRWSTYERDMQNIDRSMKETGDVMRVEECGEEDGDCEERLKASISQSHFVVLSSPRLLIVDLFLALRQGTIPVVLRRDAHLPLEEVIDWSRVLLRLPLSRLPELHFILRDIPMADALEMRRRGRRLLEEYFDSADALWLALSSLLSTRLSLPPRGSFLSLASPLFNGSFVAPIQTPVNWKDDPFAEYLGPIEAPFESPAYLHNVTAIGMYGYDRWNEQFSLGGAPEFLIGASEMPNGAEFLEDTSVGFRPIDPWSGGHEFSLALGGNRQREQFTVVMLTYNRDAVLTASLERLHRCPYLNKVIVIWNNVERDPQGAWPKLHVPVEFIRANRNSLNNRFVPWDRIQTEAVLSLDDDVDLEHAEIVFTFRVWRENRRKLVGIPAREHVRFGSDLFYNSNKTCQLSMILTGAAFIHKSYFYSYTHDMPAAIREHVDKVTNCEDIAMNFLISHLTREPPLKTTNRSTFRCPTCTESLWDNAEHFDERTECIRLFQRVYGYNPLRYSQYRADSILYKTKVPADMRKCYLFNV